jgi:chaperonin GroEL
VALLRCQAALDKVQLPEDQAAGIRVLRHAIEEPLRQIAGNAGIEGAVVVEKVRGLKASHGFNAATGVYEDLIAAGVIDPAKVVRCALQNAASVAGLMLTTEAVIADKPKEDKGGGGGHAGHGHGHDMM